MKNVLLNYLKAVSLLSLVCLVTHGQIWMLPVYLHERATETKLEFYGKLVDQNNDPVSGATVHYTLSHAGVLSPTFSPKKTKTKADGSFELHGGSIAMLYIDSFELPGYEYSHGETSFDFQTIYTSCHKADASKPIVFTCRKKHPEAVYLYERGFRLELNPQKPVEWVGYDMLKGWDLDETCMKRSKESNPFADFQLSGQYDCCAYL